MYHVCYGNAFRKNHEKYRVQDPDIQERSRPEHDLWEKDQDSLKEFLSRETVKFGVISPIQSSLASNSTTKGRFCRLTEDTGPKGWSFEQHLFWIERSKQMERIEGEIIFPDNED